MTIHSFFTSKIQGQTGLTQGAEKSPDAAGRGVDFFQFLLARTLTEQSEKLTAGTSKKDKGLLDDESGKLLQSPNPLLQTDPSLRPSDLIAATPEIAEDVQNHTVDAQDEINQTLALNVKAFIDLMKPAKTGDAMTLQKEALEKAAKGQKIPSLSETYQLGDAAVPKNLLGRLKSLLAKLENLTGTQIQTSNLDPAGLEALKAKIKSLIAAQDANTFSPEKGADLQSDGKGLPDEAMLAEITIDLIQMLPALQKMQSGMIVQTPAASISSDQSADEMAAQLSRIAPGAAGKPQMGIPADSADGVETTPEGEIFDESGQNLNFKDSLKAARASKSDTSVMDGKMQPPGPAASGALESWPFGSTGSLFASFDWVNGLLDSYGASSINGSTISGPAAMTSLVTQASGAPVPLPGTQIIAKAMQKMAEGGETRTITLQMDPPELGRVKVQMIFGKDKTVKATILAEKPETYAMLQRDAHNLERALQNAGLDADGSSIEFQLAGDNQNFSHDGGHDGSYGGYSKNGNAEAETEVIETTMTWHVDPDTGYMRYDIYA